MSPAQAAAKSRSAKTSTAFSAEEKAAMRERARETRAAAAKADGERDLLAKIAEMQKPSRVMAERLHAIVKATVPGIESKTWYGMPAYARDGNTLCFFRPAEKFKNRYSTFGFSDTAKLDDGAMWPTSFALKKLTRADEKRIAALLKKAVS